MKQFYLSFVLSIFFSLSCYAQTDLLGTWYLDYIVKDGVTYPNYFNDNLIFDLEFTNESSGQPDIFEFFSDHGCNSTSGSYAVGSSEIVLNVGATTLSDCQARAFAIYEALYNNELNYENSNALFTYEISKTGDDEILTLTNPNNTNELVLIKQAPSTLLVSTWWLYQIDIPGNPIINIPETEGPFITFTNTINTLPFIPEANGIGECEGFSTHYSVSFNGSNNLDIGSLTTTFGNCATQAYEGIYFGILGTQTTNFFEFEILNGGETLILTDLLGARLIFGSESLSIDEQSFSSVDISIKNNPVKDQLSLETSDESILNSTEYYIYSINGKSMNSGILSQNSVNVNYLESGVYFIRLVRKGAIKTIKFIKE